MNKHTKFIFALTSSIVFFNVLLSFFNENLIEAYLVIYVVLYFFYREFFLPRRKYFDYLGLGLFIIFVYIVVIYVLKSLFFV